MGARSIWLLAWSAWAGCSLQPTAPQVSADAPSGHARAEEEREAPADAGRARAGAQALRIVTWNLEWFMDPEHGPSDELRQLNGAQNALAAIDADLLALEEVGSAAALQALLQALPGMHGVLSNYDYPQRLALVYRAPLHRLSEHEIDGLDSVGRPPLAVELRDDRDGGTLWVVVLHAKAYDDETSYARRARFAQQLHDELARAYPRERLIVAGDFNDGLLSSITAGKPSPYAPFVTDPRYLAPTAELERSGREGSSAQGAMIDHILLGGELAARFAAGSADVLRDEMLARDPNFSAAVSDHFPVELQLR